MVKKENIAVQSVNINSVLNLSAAAMVVFGYLWASLVNNKRLDDFKALMDANDKAMMAEIRSVLVELRATREVLTEKIDTLNRCVSRLEDTHEHRVLKP